MTQRVSEDIDTGYITIVSHHTGSPAGMEDIRGLTAQFISDHDPLVCVILVTVVNHCLSYNAGFAILSLVRLQ